MCSWEYIDLFNQTCPHEVILHLRVALDKVFRYTVLMLHNWSKEGQGRAGTPLTTVVQRRLSWWSPTSLKMTTIALG